MPEKLTIVQVNDLNEEEFVGRFGSLYEHSPWIAERAWHERPFGSLSELHGAFVRAMYDAPPVRQMVLIRAHPDLAGKAEVAKVAYLRLKDIVEPGPTRGSLPEREPTRMREATSTVWKYRERWSS